MNDDNAMPVYRLSGSNIVHDHRTKKLIGPLLFFLAVSINSSSHAADDVQQGTSHSSPWEGLYFGASIGGSNADTTIGDVIDLTSGTPGGNNGVGAVGGNGGGLAGIIDAQSEIDNLTTGLHLGYNWVNGDAIIGIEGDIGGFGSMDNTLGSLRGRLGFTSDQFLIYGTAGLGYLSIDGGTSALLVGGAGGNGGNGGNGAQAGSGGGGGIGAFGNGFAFSRGSQSDVGLAAGIGAEYRIGPQTTIGIEGLYYNFDDLARAGFDDDDFWVVRGRISFALDANPGTSSFLGDAPHKGWSGAYFGGHLGSLFDLSDNMNSALSVNGNNGAAGQNGIAPNGGGGGGGGGAGGAAGGFFEEDDTQLLGGVQVGFNWEREGLVYGVEADASLLGDNRDYLASLRGRLGWTHKSQLYYLTGGIAATQVERATAIYGGNGGNGGDGSDSVTLGGNGSGGYGGNGGSGFYTSDSDDLVGFVIGAGVDTKIARDLSVGIEALYYKFDDDFGNSNRLNGTNGSYFSSLDDESPFVLRARLIKFF